MTTRAGGVSEGEYASMNRGTRSGDDPARVERNRLIVRGYLPSAPRWMAQVHGADVADLDTLPAEDAVPTCDAAVTSTPGRVAVVQTADCNRHHAIDRPAWVAARGLAVAAGRDRERRGALGAPGDATARSTIGPRHSRWGAEAFQVPTPARHRRSPHTPATWDLYALARWRLRRRCRRDPWRGLLHVARGRPLLLVPAGAEERPHGRFHMDGIMSGMPVLAYILISCFVGTVLSLALAALVAFRVQSQWISTLVSFAVGAMLGASFLDLLPHLRAVEESSRTAALSCWGPWCSSCREGAAVAPPPSPPEESRGRG
jgi:hypothetical protein